MDVEEYLHASTPVATTAVIKKKRMSTMTKDVGGATTYRLIAHPCLDEKSYVQS